MLFLNYYKKIRKDREKKQKNADNDNEKCVKKDIRTAIEMVAEKLHNTYNICKKSYIDPKIIENICKLNEY